MTVVKFEYFHFRFQAILSKQDRRYSNLKEPTPSNTKVTNSLDARGKNLH